MELCAEPEWLLLHILCSKAREYTRVGQAIEFWVCAQRCVCVGRLAWSRMRVFWRLQQEGRLDAQEGGERAQNLQHGMPSVRVVHK